MPYNQQMRALDQQANLAKLAELLSSTRNAGNQYSIPNWVPLAGGTGVGDMFLGNSPEEIENWSYGNAPMQIPETSRLPQFKRGRAQSLADTAITFAGPAESTARNAVAGNVGMVIKPKGGNWVFNDPSSLIHFKGLEDDLHENFPREWLRQKLAHYVKNEMATPEDPIRAVAENWPAKRDALINEQQTKIPKLQEMIARYEQNVELPPNIKTNNIANKQREINDIQAKIAGFENYNPLHYDVKPASMSWHTRNTRMNRKESGYPEEGFAKSELGKRWEDVSDYNIITKPASSFLPLKGAVDDELTLERKIRPESSRVAHDDSRRERALFNNPWLTKIDPDTAVYQARIDVLKNTGLDKLTEGLNRAISDTELPDELRIAPDKLARVTIPHAVEYVAKINAWDAAEKLKEGRNRATFMHKDYPDRGLSWMEIRMPGVSNDFTPGEDYTALGDALKFEGDTMGTCVGEYCDDVAHGVNKVYSLRDRRGEPHVTIETRKNMDTGADYIKQIKGKANEAPIDKYLPSVQDFVRSKDWERVKDFGNTALLDLDEHRRYMSPDLYNAAVSKYGKFVSDDELDALRRELSTTGRNITSEGYANGGLVGTPPTMYDPMKVDDIVASIDAPHNYAGGGSISEFEDPAHERLYRRAMAHFDDVSAKQNFGDEDSIIASTLLHPQEASKRAKDYLMRSIDTAGGRPREILDESSAFPIGVAPSIDEQSQAAFDLAGLAQTGGLPFAPTSAGGTLGMAVKPKGGNWLQKDMDFEKGLSNLILSENFPRDWINKKLTAYVKNDLGTPEDPVLAIAEKWPAKKKTLLADKKKKLTGLSKLLNKYEIEDVPTGVDNPEAWREARIRTANRDISDIEKEIMFLKDYNPIHYTPTTTPKWEMRGINRSRKQGGFPEEGLAKSGLGKNWENASDKSVGDTLNLPYLFKEKEKGDPRTDIIKPDNEWVYNLDPSSKVYNFSPSYYSNSLGFDKLISGLDKAVLDKTLPAELQIDPNKMYKMNVPQVVEHVAKLNNYNKIKEYEESVRNPAVFEHKQYPDKKLSWFEIKNPKKTIEYDDLNADDQNDVYKAARRTARSEGLDPESDDFRFRMTELMSELANRKYNEDLVSKALKYEGDRMNQCVGDYCPDVSSGNSRIFSLRNRSNEPHVTIETKPWIPHAYYESLLSNTPAEKQKELLPMLRAEAAEYNASNPHLSYDNSLFEVLKNKVGGVQENLTQVFGKTNLPVLEKYLPLVHDFMRSHPGLDVNNVAKGLKDVGVYDLKNAPDRLNEKLTEMNIDPSSFNLDEARKRFGDWASPEELKSLISGQGYAGGGSVVGDLPFNDPDQLRLYHQAMKHYDDVIENTGGSKKIGKSEARVNYTTTTKGDREHDKDLHTLIADYGLDLGNGANLNAAMIKPIEAEGVYLGNLSGSVPVGEGRASIGLQGLHTKYNDGLSGYTAGYTGKVGGGDLNASYFEPADHKSEGRQIQVEYNMPFSKGGSVTSQQENLYHTAMKHYDNLMAA
jgi:hypothetical protein